MEIAWPLMTATPELAHGEAHVWAVPIQPDSPLDAYLASLAADEWERAERFRLEGPRRQFVVGRAALKTLLAGYLGVRPAEIELTYGNTGKPELCDAAQSGWLRFNLAHSDNLALVAIVRDCDVGIDVERIRRVNHMEQIADRYLHESEASELRAMSPEARVASFVRCWTAKEAVLKAAGIGLSGSLKKFLVPLAEGDSAWISTPAEEPNAPAQYWLQWLAPCDGYLGAVAFAEQQCRSRFFTFGQGQQKHWHDSSC